MRRKKRLIIGVIIILVAALAYWKFYYKTFSERFVAANADMIVAVDVKRITNTVIWDYITTPSKWKKISFKRSKEKSWKDAIELPDYFFLFTVSGQPGKYLYCVLKIRSDEALQLMLPKYGFEKIAVQGKAASFRSNNLRLSIIRYDDKLLVSNAPVDAVEMQDVADRLFNRKQHINRDQLYVNVKASSHLSLQMLDSATLRSEALMRVNFDDNRISFDGSFANHANYRFAEQRFPFNSDGLFSLNFTQPPSKFLADIPAAVKSKISNAVNFNVDSFLLPSNKSYQVDLPGFRSRLDSAVTYTYDDNFNQVPQVVINKVTEPSLALSVNGTAVETVYGYWSRTGLVEKDTMGEVFLAIPYVKTYFQKRSSTEMLVASAGYQPQNSATTEPCIFHCRMNFSKLPANLINYVPPGLAKAIKAVDFIEVSAANKDKAVVISGEVTNRKQGQDWFSLW